MQWHERNVAVRGYVASIVEKTGPGGQVFFISPNTEIGTEPHFLSEATPVRSERSRVSGEVEERDPSGLAGLRLRCATLRPNDNGNNSE